MENVCIYTLLIVASFQFIETADFSDRSIINLLAEKVESTNLKLSELSFELQETKKEFQKSKKQLRKTKKGLKDAKKGLKDAKNELKETKNELKETKDSLEETKVAFEQIKQTCSGKETFHDVERVTPIHPAVLKGFADEKNILQRMKRDFVKTMAHYGMEIPNPISRYEVNVTSILKGFETITNKLIKDAMALHEAEKTSFKMDVELLINITMGDIKEDLVRYENDMTSFKNELETIISNENDKSKWLNGYMTSIMSSYRRYAQCCDRFR